jgi:hypothetical protein
MSTPPPNPGDDNVTNNPLTSTRVISQNEDRPEKDRNVKAFEPYTDRGSNPLLRIMQHQSSGYSGQSGIGNAGVPEWFPPYQGGTKSPFHHTETQSPFWKFVNGF